MPRKKRFVIKEIFRNLRLNYQRIIRYFLSLSTFYAIIIIIFIYSFNLNYYKQTIEIMSISFGFSPLPVIKDIGYPRFLLLIIFILFLYFFIKINRLFIVENINFYQHEINLIKMINGNSSIVKKTIVNIVLIINTLSLLLVISLVKILYGFMYSILAETYSDKMIKFGYFDTSLFIFLFIITSLLLILITYILYQEKKV